MHGRSKMATGSHIDPNVKKITFRGAMQPFMQGTTRTHA